MLYSLFWRTISHSGAVMDSVLRLTNVVFWGFSWDLCIWMTSCSIFSAKVGISWSIHLENVAEIGIKFRLDKFPHKIANMFQLRDFAPFSDVCSHIFPLFNQMIWQTSDNLSEIVIGVDVGEVIDMAKRCKQLIVSRENSRRACLSSGWFFFLSVIFLMNALAMTLGWPNFPLVFSVRWRTWFLVNQDQISCALRRQWHAFSIAPFACHLSSVACRGCGF